MNVDLRLGDCLEVLKTIPDNSVDSIVIDPPYGLGFMNKEWDSPEKLRELTNREAKRSVERKAEGKSPTDAPFSKSVPPGLAIKGAKEGKWFQEWCELWSKECLRVLKSGGHMVSFSSPRTYHRMTTGIEDAGFEIRDQILWVFGSGFPKSHNIGKAIDKIQGNDREVVGDNPNHRESDALYELGFQGGKGDGVITKGNSEWEGFGTAMKPAQEPITLAKKEGDDLIDIDTQPGFYYGAKANKKDRNEGLNGFEAKRKAGAEFRPNHMDKALTGNTGNPFGRWNEIQNNHPTVKPTELMKYLIKLITPPNGVVLDIFMGSGSTGKAAVQLGYSFIGIEREQEYFEIAKARINHEVEKRKNIED